MVSVAEQHQQQQNEFRDIRTDKIMIILGRKNPKNMKMGNDLEKNYQLIKDLDVIIIRENKGQNRSEKILELIETEVESKRDLINDRGNK